MLYGKLFAYLHSDRLRVWLVALFPENKCRGDLQLLRDNRLEREDRLRVRGFVGLHGHSIDLSASAIANVKCGGNLAGPAGGNFVLLGLCSGATAGSVNRLKVHRCLAGVLIFEMADRLFVGSRWTELDLGLLPFQFGACAEADDDGQGKSNDVCFHFLE